MVASPLHPRNRHRGGYDLARLAAAFSPLQPHVIPGRPDSANALTVDFSKPAAVSALNAALLSVDYKILDFELPEGQLTPAVPGRAEYLHLLADLLASEADGQIIPRGTSVRGLDIGTGCSCVYPLIGHAEYGWSFLGSDVDNASLAAANAIVRANQYPIELRLQTNGKRILTRDLLRPNEQLAFTMCNPPFYKSAAEAEGATARKWAGLQRGKKSRGGKGGKGKGGRGGQGASASSSVATTRSFAGSESELWTPGGEKAFVARHIRESAQMARAALWFTSLVSAESSLPKLRAELASSGARCVVSEPNTDFAQKGLTRPPISAHAVLTRCTPAHSSHAQEELGTATGNKQMRVLAWSYQSDAERRERIRELAPGGGGDPSPNR